MTYCTGDMKDKLKVQKPPILVDVAVCTDNSCLLSSRLMLTHQSARPADACHRIIELARLEKISEIIQSNRPPTTNISH